MPSLKSKLLLFHQNLKNCTVSLNKSKDDLTIRMENLSESFDRIKSLFYEKKEQLSVKLSEEESIKINAIDANPMLINLLKTFTKLTNSKKFTNNPVKNHEEIVKNISENDEKEPKTIKKIKENESFEEAKPFIKRKTIKKNVMNII